MSCRTTAEYAVRGDFLAHPHDKEDPATASEAYRRRDGQVFPRQIRPGVPQVRQSGARTREALLYAQDEHTHDLLAGRGGGCGPLGPRALAKGHQLTGSPQQVATQKLLCKLDLQGQTCI